MTLFEIQLEPNPEHVAKLFEGVAAWNKWREENPDIRPNLAGLKLTPEKVKGTPLWNQRLGRVDLTGVNFNKTGLQFARLKCAIILDARYQGAHLWQARLQGANLERARLQDAVLTEARLQGANLGGARLQGANLGQARLQGANLILARLQGADLLEARLHGANLMIARLKDADLSEARLQGAHFWGARLQGANLSGARLQYADLSGADLEEANASGVRYTNTTFRSWLWTWILFALLKLANRSLAEQRGWLFDKALDRGLLRWSENTRKYELVPRNKIPWPRYRGIRVSSCHGSQRFRRFAMDEDYLEEMRAKRPLLYWAWRLTSDCGRSGWIFLAWCMLIPFLFGLFYARLPVPSWLPDGAAQALVACCPDVANAPGTPAFDTTGLDPFYFSFLTFTCFGYGSYQPLNTAGKFLVMVEQFLGFLALGSLISLISNILGRRSG